MVQLPKNMEPNYGMNMVPCSNTWYYQGVILFLYHDMVQKHSITMVTAKKTMVWTWYIAQNHGFTMVYTSKTMVST